jgi:regulator of replication initiation timing
MNGNILDNSFRSGTATEHESFQEYQEAVNALLVRLQTKHRAEVTDLREENCRLAAENATLKRSLRALRLELDAKAEAARAALERVLVADARSAATEIARLHAADTPEQAGSLSAVRYSGGAELLRQEPSPEPELPLPGTIPTRRSIRFQSI